MLAAAGGGLGLGSMTLLATVAASGPDLIGWAAVITAASGFIGTLIMGIVRLVQLFRRSTPEAYADAIEHKHPRHAREAD